MKQIGNKKWSAKWIEPVQKPIVAEPEFTLEEMFSGKIKKQAPVEERLHSPIFLKRVFTICEGKAVAKAMLTMTAHGVYLAEINGEKVTDALFTPDYTSYNHYLQYQEYDITSLIAEKNVWSVVLADGWYGGRVSVNGGSAQFGSTLGILGEIQIEYSDGSKETICTDEGFVSGSGKYIYSDIFIGEKQDLRLQEDGWDKDFNIERLNAVNVVVYPMDNLVSQQAEYVKAMEEIAPTFIWQEGNAYIIDFGQVIAGRVRLDIDLAEGEEITLEHSEMLNEKGIFFNNIKGRNKDQRDIYIGRGRREVLEPDFTFHGFRYARLSGYSGEITKDSARAIVLYTDMKKTGSFVTDNADINQLISNIEWSQKGNMLSIPTDCPQRERVGWTGDMQVFAPTATFFMDVYDFIRRWLDNVRCEQLPNGEVIDYTPAPSDYFNTPSLTGTHSSAGWGDAIVMVPWTLYQRYGKTEILEENYEAMVKWQAFSKQSAAGEKTGHKRYLWDTKFHFGDWMFPSFMMGPNAKGPIATSEATKEIFGTAFLANSSALLAEIAKLLGKEEDAKAFKEYSGYVKAAFEEEYYRDGLLTSDLQGCYVIAIAFDMLNAEAKEKAVSRLVELIKENGNRLDAGFLSITYLLDVLVDNNQIELAKTVFLQEECPSWLYEVKNGATTIWESWAAVQPDGTVGDFSFNHYAFGCVGDWMVRKIAGLNVKEVGYKEFYVTPNLNLGAKEFALKFQSPFGEIVIEVKGNNLKVAVPENSRAYVTLPGGTKTAKELTAGTYNFTF